MTPWAASGSLRTYADDARWWEVGWPHSTGEASRTRVSACGTTQVVRTCCPRRGWTEGGQLRGIDKRVRIHRTLCRIRWLPRASRADTAAGTSGCSCCSLLHVITRGRSRVRYVPLAGICAGGGLKGLSLPRPWVWSQSFSNHVGWAKPSVPKHHLAHLATTFLAGGMYQIGGSK